jgi:hypothetical protein
MAFNAYGMHRTPRVGYTIAISPCVQYGRHSISVHRSAAAEAAVSIVPAGVWRQRGWQLLPVQQVGAGGVAPAQTPAATTLERRWCRPSCRQIPSAK